jgi:hypothetical protein
MKTTISFLISCLSVLYSKGQAKQLFLGQDPSKCYNQYAIVVKPAVEQSHSIEIVQYTGDEDSELLNSKAVVEMSIEIAPARKDWVKINGECSAENLWGIRDIPAKTRTFTIVKDTNLIKDFIKTKVKILESESFVTKMEWLECVCRYDISIDLKDKIKESLVEEGYLLNEISKDCEIMEALSSFQRANRLPQDHYNQEIGMSINMETMKALYIQLGY